MESRLILAIEVSKAAQPVLAVADGDSSDEEATDEETGMATQTALPGVGGADGGSAFDDDGPTWPDEAQESEMRAAAVDRGETLSSRAAREAAEAAAEAAAEKSNLPSLDALIDRIPAEVRDTLEDLFRAKFVKVARVPKKALKG